MENMPKKGSTTLIAVIIIIAILAVFIVLGFIFPKVKYILVGSGFIIGGFIFLFKNISSNKKFNRESIIGMLIVFGIGIFFILGSSFLGNVLQTIMSYDIVYKQNYGNICCVQEDDYDIVFTRYIDDVSVFSCNDYTNECRITISLDRDLGIPSAYGAYQICNIGGTNCLAEQTYSGYKKGQLAQFIIKVGQEVRFFPDRLLTTRESTTVVSKEAKSFYIKGMENGFIYRQESCVLSADLKQRVASNGLNELSKTGANSCQNYMIDFIQTATKTYKYNSKEVICQARQLYLIDSVTFKDGVTRKIQGERTAIVECCPAEANCDENTFTFKDDLPPKECTYSSECPNAGNPIAVDSTHYVTYSCSSEGQCVKSATKTTECTVTSECISKYGQGYVCDLSLSNWGKCKLSTLPHYCGDGTCDSLDGETKDTCAADCGSNLTCSWYQEKTPQTEDYGLFGWRHLFNNPIIVEPKCTTAGWFYMVILGTIISVLIIAIVLILKPAKVKRRRH